MNYRQLMELLQKYPGCFESNEVKKTIFDYRVRLGLQAEEREWQQQNVKEDDYDD